VDTTVLRIKGNVIPTSGKLRKRIGFLNSDSNRIDFKDVLYPNKVKQVVEIENSTKDKIELSVLNPPEYISVKIDHKTLEPGERGKITVTYNSKKKENYGKSTDHVRFNIKASEKNVSGTLTVIANKVEDFSKLTKQELAEAPIIFLPKNRLDIGNVKINETKSTEILFENKGKTDLIIRNIEINNNLFQLQNFDPIVKPEEKGKIIITAKPIKASSNMKAYITIISNDPQSSTVRLLVQGLMKKDAPALNKSEKELTIPEKKTYEMIKEYKGSDKLVIIDLRSEKEFKLKHIPDAINIEFNKNYLNIVRILNKNKIFILYSDDNMLSKEAVIKMKELDFEEAFYLENGIIGWEKNGLPLDNDQ
jgi:rhodanese-related sulfurtransferase